MILACHSGLLRLLESCAGVDRLVAQGSSLPHFDVHAPLLSLPGILGTTLSTIPAEVPYLFADANLVKQWRQKLAGLGEFKIGIAWEGNPGYKANRVRSCGRAAFAPLARLEGVRLISLQKGTGADKPADDANSFFVTDLGSDFDKVSGAFMDTAAVMEQLELVVSVDTSVAHCAGALGVPVWVALPFAPDWRWLLEREDSPWYPTMRLFRQRRWGDWDEVFQRIADEVQKLLLLRDRLGEDLSAKKASVSSDRRGLSPFALVARSRLRASGLPQRKERGRNCRRTSPSINTSFAKTLRLINSSFGFEARARGSLNSGSVWLPSHRSACPFARVFAQRQPH